MVDTAPMTTYAGSPKARRRATSPYTHPELAAGATPKTPYSIQDSMSQVGQLMREKYLQDQKKKKVK